MKFVLAAAFAASSVTALTGVSQGRHCTDHNDSAVTWSINRRGWRQVNSNSIPAYPVDDYCPFGVGGLYCGVYKKCPSGVWGVAGELCIPEGSGMTLDWGPGDVGSDRHGSDWGTIASDRTDCPQPSWETATCPTQNDVPSDQGDCPKVSNIAYQFPMAPLPGSKTVGPQKYYGLNGVALDGVGVDGPREAGGLTLEEANIVKNDCNGHPTPGMGGARYHYHMSPHCAWGNEDDEFANFEGEHYTEVPTKHSPLLAWEFDGFGLYGHQDEALGSSAGESCSLTCDGNDDCTDTCDGRLTCHCGMGAWTGMDYCRTSGDRGTCESKPVTDRCNGHFGPTPKSDELTYHYHVRTTPPYTLGCFGPEWDECEALQGSDAHMYCSEECTSIVDGLCVQPGFASSFNITEVEFGTGYVRNQQNV